MKIRTIGTIEEADALIASVTTSANKTLARVGQLILDNEGLSALWMLKTHQIGYDPLQSEAPLNLIEQLNQSFTYIATARAVKLLLAMHADLAPFRVHMGTTSGTDIESVTAGGLAAEVFAAVAPSNNRKLAADIRKVKATEAEHRYAFFMCPGYAEGRQIKLERDPAVQVWSVGAVI